MFKFFHTLVFKIIMAVLVLLFLTTVWNHQSGRISSDNSNFVSYLLTPAEKAIAWVGDCWDSKRYLWTEKKQLQAEIAAWKSKYEQERLDNQQLAELRHENKRLCLLLQFKNAYPEYQLQAARIIGRSYHSWYRTVTIDQGSEHGIRTNMPVIQAEGLVGVVGTVNDASANVYLITDREVAVGAVLQENRDTCGIVQGTGESDRLQLINVPYYAPIKAGDILVTSGLSQIYPKGIKIGTISALSREESGLLYTVSVQPAVDFDSLEEVLVITSYTASVASSEAD